MSLLQIGTRMNRNEVRTGVTATTTERGTKIGTTAATTTLPLSATRTAFGPWAAPGEDPRVVSTCRSGAGRLLPPHLSTMRRALVIMRPPTFPPDISHLRESAGSGSTIDPLAINLRQRVAAMQSTTPTATEGTWSMEVLGTDSLSPRPHPRAGPRARLFLVRWFRKASTLRD